MWLIFKKSACNAGDVGLIPGLGKSPAEGSGNPLQYSCLGNPIDRGAWGPTVHGDARVRHDLATKPPPPPVFTLFINWYCLLLRDEMVGWRHQLNGHESVLVAQSCRTLCDPMDCSPPGSSVHGISQARILEWVAISCTRGSPQPRD